MAASSGGRSIDAAMKNEIVATYALLLAVRTSDSCATVAATARPMARPMCSALPKPIFQPRYAAKAAHAATATMYVAAHGESSWNWLMAAGLRPVPRLKSLTKVPRRHTCHQPMPPARPLLHTASLQVASLHTASLQVASLHVASLHVASLHVAAVVT